MFAPRVRCLFALCLFLASWSRPASAQTFLDRLKIGKPKQHKQEPVKPLFKGQFPPTTMVQFANVLDILEEGIRDDGVVVIKQPDVWGQARMTAYRKDFETHMKDELGNFQFVLSARVARTDQAALDSQTALSASLTPLQTRGTNVTLSSSTEVQAEKKALDDVTKALLANTKPELTKNETFILLEKAFKGINVGREKGNLGVEPPIYLDEKKRYLDHLNELRRVNLGDDTADSAGYGMYLVRMPVSIDPGEKTREGHGAILTTTVQHEFRPMFLQNVFRNLVINDLVDQLTPILFEILEHELIEEVKKQPNQEQKTLIHKLEAKLQETTNSSVRFKVTKAIPSNIVGASVYPVALTDFVRVFGARNLALLAVAVRDHQHIALPRATDIRGFLRRELASAYDLMERGVKGMPPPLADAELVHRILRNVRDRDYPTADNDPHHFHDLLESLDIRYEHEKNYPIGALCWGIAVDAGLLNERLQDEIRRMAGCNGFTCADPPESLLFYLPPVLACTDAGVKAEEAFQHFVKARWPIVAFALDPVVDQQNIADAFSRRRELQLALAYAFATGRVNFNQVTRYQRRLELDAQTIALNRTVSAFAHGNDTFGWRFMPRYQNPPEEKSNLHTAANLLYRGGPGRDYGTRKSRLENGQRELTVVLLMPSFMDRMRMDVTGNWFRLTNSDDMRITTGRMLELGRYVEEMKTTTNVCDADHYREADILRLKSKLDQLERMLPMQTHTVPVPYENTLGGFALFSQGTTALAPELIGYEGADSLTQGTHASLLIYGKNFSIHETQVVAGGRTLRNASMTEDAVQILSRQVIRVVIPGESQPTLIVDGKEFVEIVVGTPNGISNRLLLPFRRPVPATPAPTTPAVEFTMSPASLTMAYRFNDMGQVVVDLGSTNLNLTRNIADGLIAKSLRVAFSFNYPEGKTILAADVIEALTLNAMYDATNNVYTISAAELKQMASAAAGVLAKTQMLKVDKPGTFKIVSTAIKATPTGGDLGAKPSAIAEALEIVFEYKPKPK